MLAAFLKNTMQAKQMSGYLTPNLCPLKRGVQTPPFRDVEPEL